MDTTGRIPVRELRNDVSAVLRRVESGETLEVTVNNRPVALLTPRAGRPTTMPAGQFLDGLHQSDHGLTAQLAAELTQSTDDLVDPWSR